MHWPQTFSALRNPNYRIWFAGQLVSLVGTWMQSTAQGYLVYELTGSAAYLGLVSFASGAPSWFLMLYGGVIADRIPRRTLLSIVQAAMMVLAFIQAALVFSGLIQAWHIVILAALLGVANAFDAPARQAFVVELVRREDLNNAIAINSMMFNTAVVVGPAFAGFVYAKLGPAWCFTVNGLSYIAVIIALLMMKLKPIERATIRSSTLNQLREGLQYTLHTGSIRWLILNMGMISLFGLSMMTLVPAWAVDVLGGDVQTNGLLLSARGVGALAGALLVAWIGLRWSRGKLWTIGNLMLPLSILIFARVTWLPLSLLVMVFVGWSFMVQANTSNALVQSQVTDQIRGRVMSVYTLIFQGMYPLGSLLVGSVAERLSPPTALTINGVLLLAFAVGVLLFLPQMQKQV